MIALAGCSRAGASASNRPISQPPSPAPGSGSQTAEAPVSVASHPSSSEDGRTAEGLSATDATRERTVSARGDALRVGMEHYGRALRALETGQRVTPVRMLWLGDSHAAADYWPNAVRVRLQQRFGSGGPGFVHLGLAHYRHASVVVEHQGPWRVEPTPPATRTRQGDGVYGLGGIRTVPLAPDSRASVSLSPGAVRGRTHWKLFARLDEETSRLTVRLGSAMRTLRHQSDAPSAEPLGIDLVGEATDTLVVEAPVGRPRLFGAIAEGEAGGVVIDTLGINGARVETALAWAEAFWQSAVADRDPDLVIIEYGTNEVFDALAPDRYRGQYEALLERIAQASPEAACLLVGPTAVGRGGIEAQQRAAHIEAVQRATAEAWGCLFFSAALAMGGYASFARWSELSPPLASRDGVHLTPAGYKVIGEAMADMLLEQYERFVGAE
jgi:lysophospholipase L1-like esterase